MSASSVDAAQFPDAKGVIGGVKRFRDGLMAYLPRGGVLPCAQWNKRHRAMNIALWLHVPTLFILGVVTAHGPFHVFLEVMLLVLAATVARAPSIRRGIQMVANTFGLLTASALLVHFSHGTIEMHFHYFVIVAAVTLYQAWMPFLLAIAYVVAQHGVIGGLDPASVYNHPAAIASPWKWALIHALFILGECVTLLIVWRLNEDSRDEAEASYQHRLKEQEARQEAQERYGRIFETAVEGIYEATVEGEIKAANPALARILGYGSVGEFVGTTTMADHYVDPEARDRFLQMLDTRDTVVAFEFEARRKDGEVVVFSHNARAVRDPEGRMVGTQGMLEDITEGKDAERKQRELEDQLRQAQKMEAFGQLAGGVAHDFNNLLSVIENNARFAVEGLHESDQRAQDMNEVLRASQRGAELVRQLLAFSRKDVVSPAIVSLNSLVTDLGKMLRRTLGEDVQLEINLDPDLWSVEIDPGHVEQILINLALNARHAMHDGGRLAIRTYNNHGNLESDPLGKSRYVGLVIEDDGSGMTAEVKDRIFEPFFTTKDVGSGTGLGLATVYGIVRHWNGRITVDSEPGKGTTFKIYLPATDDQPIDEESLSTDQPDLRGKETILVVEDQTDVLDVVSRILRTNGYQVLRAGSVAEATDLVDQHGSGIDLVLTDVVMPGGSGTDFHRQLAESHPGLEVVLMSGYTGDATNGANGHGGVEVQLRKPFGAIELLSLTRKVLDGRRVAG